jgi:hypothetical protein
MAKRSDAGRRRIRRIGAASPERAVFAVAVIRAPAGGATAIFGSDIARVLDDGELRVLAVLGKGATDPHDFAARRRLVLGRIQVAEKSNELVAIRKLLDLLATAGAVVGPSAVNATSEATQCASTPASKASAEPYPSSAKWSRCFLRCGVVVGM